MNGSSNYIDLVEVLQGQNSYTDFEGLAGREHVDAMLLDAEVSLALSVYEESLRSTVCTLMVHWVYENHDQAGYLVTKDETVDFVHNVAFVLGSRFWMKEDASEEDT